MIPYGRQNITDADVAAVVRALHEPLLTQGPLVQQFETALADAVGAQFAVVVNSGTAALHAAYFAAGVGPGAGVVTTPVTFVATANAAYYLNGNVRFVDIDRDTVLLDPAGLEEVGSGVRVVAPVHFGGNVANMKSIATIASNRGWLVVEDAAHALGARYDIDGVEYRVGACAHSQMCCFSFHPVKHITTGEGGAITTNDPVLRDSLLRFRSHGITRDPAQLEMCDGPWFYEQQDLGFNYRITDVQCALGLSQLQRLPAIVERRRQVAAQYDELFSGNPNVRPISTPPWSRSSYHLYVVNVPASIRRPAFESLRASGIGVNVHYIPVHLQPYHRARVGTLCLPNAESYYAGALTIPMFPELSRTDVERVATLVQRVVHEWS